MTKNGPNDTAQRKCKAVVTSWGLEEDQGEARPARMCAKLPVRAFCSLEIDFCVDAKLLNSEN